MNFSIRPELHIDNISLIPLHESDFEGLYAVASDPKVWEQHPNKNRWQKDVFLNFFTGAIQSHGAFKVVDSETNTILGSTRFYDYKPTDNSILIGYTFYGTAFWGKGINSKVKTAMLNYIFQFVDQVYFHIGATNIRSQIAISRLGAIKAAEQEVTYFGEEPKLNFVYVITKTDWNTK
ncbi:GNAT family N-acetyltransferase [Flavobacterium agricola]|uniref:GNAT family N-acetyltransferase n=1 Tax=Flavobacterium agricola TaxID=2870839 RepID=A0ABY6M3U8_9FLAO|nr:GNAT family N-acetyltransferase [Flavobacterium agricola]UYW01911.1 GNAT family N-acetyltransferase [Flavobacterium agricola]